MSWYVDKCADHSIYIDIDIDIDIHIHIHIHIYIYCVQIIVYIYIYILCVCACVCCMSTLCVHVKVCHDMCVRVCRRLNGEYALNVFARVSHDRVCVRSIA
jgi:hypothetical protein